MKESKIQSDFITAMELRSWLKLNRTTQHRWVKEGKLKAYKIASKIFFKKSEVEKAIEESAMT